MFTIRINWPYVEGEVNHTVLSCSEYSVSETKQVVKLDVHNSDISRTYHLERGCVVYVMNEQGRTIDTIEVSQGV